MATNEDFDVNELIRVAEQHANNTIAPQEMLPEQVPAPERTVFQELGSEPKGAFTVTGKVNEVPIYLHFAFEPASEKVQWIIQHAAKFYNRAIHEMTPATVKWHISSIVFCESPQAFAEDTYFAVSIVNAYAAYGITGKAIMNNRIYFWGEDNEFRLDMHNA